MSFRESTTPGPAFDLTRVTSAATRFGGMYAVPNVRG